MTRAVFLSALLSLFLPVVAARAFDDGPPISITSPDAATTYAYSSIKEHELFWDKKTQTLIARVVFTPVDSDSASADDDSHNFRLPGVTFDHATGIFSAVTAAGDSIPVAKIRKRLFLTIIETLPNAVVRIHHERGQVSVVMEAVRPDSPEMRAPAPDQPHAVGFKQLIQ
jgi:hypothetical protein